MWNVDDLNDLALFAAVVSHGGFSGAARALGIPKSRLSRRVAELESRLAVRLLQRSTRSVSVTEVGAAFFAHCESVSASARAAYEVAARANATPSGRLKVSCPIGIAQMFLAPLLPEFLLAHPEVRLDLDLTNRRVDVIGEGYDLALRMRSTLEDSDLVIRPLGETDQLLVASPDFVARQGPFDSIEALQGVRGMGPAGVRGQKPCWSLTHRDGAVVEVAYRPCCAVDDVGMKAGMAVAGVGVAQLPFHVCANALRDGRLIDLLPDYRPQPHQLHAVYPSRRGMAPALRAFVDMLAEKLPPTMEDARHDFRRRMEGGDR